MEAPTDAELEVTQAAEQINFKMHNDSNTAGIQFSL